jgi:tRNA A-37 threonylcarbamoyl transferase component Bud32
MTPSTTGEIAASRCPSARFADDNARQWLQDELEALQRPTEPAWLLVKRNASRSVYRGQVAGRGVYLKHFHSRSAFRRLLRRVGLCDARRELELARLLAERGVSATPVLAAAWGKGVEWVASEEVAPACAGDEWHVRELGRGAGGLDAIRHASRELARLLAKLHDAGVVHRDMHCGNVLVRTDALRAKLVLMDLHSARASCRVSRRARAMNLAQLCYDRTHLTSRTERLRFLRDYLRFSGAKGTLRGWEWLVSFFARRHARRIETHRDRRIRGRNRYFTLLSPKPTWKARVILASKRRPPHSLAANEQIRPEDWANALRDPASLLDRDGAEVVKDSPSCTVLRRRLRVGSRELDVFIKHPLRRRGRKALLDGLRGSRTMRAFRLGHMLLTRRVPTALPLVALERRRGPFITNSILITEAAPGVPLGTYLSQAADSTPNRTHRLLGRLGRLVRRLHEMGFTHRDLKAGNILVHAQDEAGGPRPLLVDLDGLAPTRLVTSYRMYRDFARLNVALVRSGYVTSAGRLRALLGYLSGPGCGRIAFKVPWRVVDDLSAEILARQDRSRRRRSARTHR